MPLADKGDFGQIARLTVVAAASTPATRACPSFEDLLSHVKSKLRSVSKGTVTNIPTVPEPDLR